MPSPAAEAPRTITLAPHLTELAFAAGGGDALVGVVEWSDYPPEAAKLPIIGDAFRFDLEAIIELDAELALAWRGGTPPAAVERLESLDIEVIWVETRSLEEIALALETVGDALTSGRQAAMAAETFRERLDTLPDRQNPGGRVTTVFYQASARPLFTLGSRHVINDVFETCGARNVFDDLDTEAASVDIEAVLSRQPDLIIAGIEDQTEDPLARWKDSSLVKVHGTTLHTVDPSLLVRPTPRIIEGIEFVCTLVAEHT